MEEKKTGISGAMLANAKSAEAMLAKAEARRKEDALPDGHPLKAEVERQKAAMGGDLSGLPPGHPLLRAMDAAKKAREQREVEARPKQETKSEVRKAKRLDVDEAKRVARRREEEEKDRRLAVVGDVNKGIETVLRGVTELFRMVAENEMVLGADPVSRAKSARLKRILFAAERGVAECRIARL